MASSVNAVTPGQPAPTNSADWQSGSIPNIISFRFDAVQPPSLVYVQRDDLLVVNANTQLAAGDVLTITARLLEPTAQTPAQPLPAAQAMNPIGVTTGPGHIQPIQQVLKVAAGGATASVIVPLMEGYLLSVAVSSANALTIGETFVSVFIGRGSPGGATPTPAQLLIADYMTSTIPAGWPSVFLRSGSANSGALGSVIGSAPLAGHEWSYMSPAHLRTRVHSITATLSTSAVVANRTVRIHILDTTPSDLGFYATAVTQAASLIYRYTFALGIGRVDDSAGSKNVNLPLPQVDLLPGWQVLSDTLLIDPGDQWSAPVLNVEQWAI